MVGARPARRFTAADWWWPAACPPGPTRRRRALRLALAAAAALAASACSSADPASAPAAARGPDLGSMLPATIRSGGLTVLTDPEFEPVSFYAPGTRVIAGSDPDIVRAIAKVLGVRVAFTPIGFEGMLTGLASGRGDVAAGGITDTTQREQAVRFVDDFRLGELFVVRRSNDTGISAAPLSACGRTVAYTFGAVSQTAVSALSRQCTAAGKSPIRPVGVAGVPAAVLAVLSGRVQVALYDDLGFAALNKANGGQLAAFRVTPYPGQYWGIAVARGDQQLAAALLAGLRAIVADGTYKKILGKYGLGNDALASPGVNLQSSRPQS